MVVVAPRGIGLPVPALCRFFRHPQGTAGAVAVRYLSVQTLVASAAIVPSGRHSALHWTQRAAGLERQPPTAHQCRWYGSKKKGKKHHKEEEEEKEPGESEADVLPDMDATKEHMNHCLERFATELRAMRAGRANPGILDRVRVTLGHESAPLSDVAVVTIKDAQNLLVLANDPDHKTAIDTSIRNANLGLNPRIDKNNAIIVPVPKSTKESRDKMVKQVEALAERTRMSVRKYRQDAMKQLKAAAKSGAVSKDEVKTWEKDIQTVTDNFVDKVKDLVAAKTQEIEKT
ncbi:hypothetical protein H4S06_002059 [Coemansia sp. BCRC 34490]|nr:hypothetical protein H4S06_002059 [Coemansia sp. BCRC 34490]